MLTKEDAEGRLILSKKRARFEMAWKAIEQAAESGEPVDGKVIEVVKGGLILDLGVRGFLPASLVDIRRVQDLDEFLGQELRAKVIELNRSRNNVVLSRRAVLEDERKEQRQQILDRLNPGDVVDGQISNIVDFGAFVDLDGMDGLIHISELSWSHVNHPSEVLEIGQDVKVKVLDIDRERQRISLGLKQTQSDPWQEVLDEYHEGDEVEGKVTKVVTFGAFVEIMPGVEGLVHISELAQHHVENPREVVSQGDLVKAKIIEVDAERRRLSLSLKRVEGGGVTQRADDSEAVEGTPNLDLSEEVFPEGGEEPAAEVEAEPRSRSRRSQWRSRRRRPSLPRSRSRRPARRGAGRGGRARRGPVARQPAEEPPAEEPEPEPQAAEEPEPEPEAGDSEPEAKAADARVACPDRSPSPSRAASGRGRARPSPRSRATAQPPSRATRSSTGSCARTTRCDKAVLERFGDEILDGDGEIDRSALAEIVFADREALDWLENAAPPEGRSAEQAAWREELERLPDPPAVCVAEIPLLFETGGQERFDAVVVVTAPAELRAARTQVPPSPREARLHPGRREGEAGGLRLRQRRHARGARRVRRRGDARPAA